MFFLLSIRHLGFANGTSYQVLIKSHIFQNINKKAEKIIWNWKSNWDSHMKANMSFSLSTNETLGEIGAHTHTINYKLYMGQYEIKGLHDSSLVQ